MDQCYRIGRCVFKTTVFLEKKIYLTEEINICRTILNLVEITEWEGAY